MNFVSSGIANQNGKSGKSSGITGSHHKQIVAIAANCLIIDGGLSAIDGEGILAASSIEVESFDCGVGGITRATDLCIGQQQPIVSAGAVIGQDVKVSATS